METKITVAAVGDIFMGRGAEDTINAKGPGYIFDLVQPYFRGSDIVFGNLESPVSGKKVTGQGLIAKPAALDELKEAGFNAVAIANNHIMDFGLPILQDTIGALQKRNISYAGAGLNESDARQPLTRAGGKDVV
ncbi:MAG: CapA family protein, partial [Anaerolineae bacterium]